MSAPEGWFPLCMSPEEWASWQGLLYPSDRGRLHPCSFCPSEYASAMKYKPKPVVRPPSSRRNRTVGCCNPPTRPMSLLVYRRIAVYRSKVWQAAMRETVMAVRRERSR